MQRVVIYTTRDMELTNQNLIADIGDTSAIIIKLVEHLVHDNTIWLDIILYLPRVGPILEIQSHRMCTHFTYQQKKVTPFIFDKRRKKAMFGIQEM
jgi:hypothetical protein